MSLSDVEVMEVLALVMTETLAVGSEVIEYLGEHCAIDMAEHWEADEAFLGVLRDREVMLALLAETGGSAVASANASEKGATIKGLIADHLTGANDRPKCERWVPRWMAFPPRAYSERGGVPMVAAARRAKWMIGEEKAAADDEEAALIRHQAAQSDDLAVKGAVAAQQDDPQGAALAA
jgi:ParB family chromosome partitioning protein